MSRKLTDFIELLQSDKAKRDALEMGTFVTWLRRRNPILRNLETEHVIEVIRNSHHEAFKRDDVIFRQGEPRDSESSLKVYIILRGSASLFSNPFMSQGKSSRRSSYSLERILLASSVLDKSHSKPHPKSATSKSTGTRLSPILYTSVNEDFDEFDIDDNDRDDVSINQIEEGAVKGITQDGYKESNFGTVTANQEGESRNQVNGSPLSRVSQRSTQSVRAKMGNFVVKYEKGKYVSEEAILNDDDAYTGSVIVDEHTDMMEMDENTFDKYIKEHHDKDAVDLIDYVDYHPFFRDLPLQSKGMIQISLKKHHYNAGTFIVKQGEPVKCLNFIISGSAELILEPGKHRYQFPEFWPFETSSDVYYKECDWLRESRRRVYQQQYQCHGEVTRRYSKRLADRKEISMCAVLDREVLGVTELMLNLNTYVQGYRCLHDCDVYSLGVKPLRRVLRRNGTLNELILAYVKMKLQFRMKNSLGDKVPLLNCLYNKVESENKEKSFHFGVVTKGVEKLKDREAELKKALKWFKMDKAPLINNKDPGVIQLKEDMKKRARIRQSVKDHLNEKPFFRRGCMRAVKPNREPMSLHKLRNPMNEMLLRLRMEGTYIQNEDELEEILLRYSETPVDREEDITRQRQRFMDEEYNLFRYRRYGNQLVRKFSSMLQHRNKSRDQSVMAMALFQDGDSEIDAGILPVEECYNDDVFESAPSRLTKHTAKSFASTYRTLQFDRRSVTPGTIEMRVKDFHERCGDANSQIHCVPTLARYDVDGVDPEDAPLPGGKVFVTKAPCVSCHRNILLKNHSHRRFQMLHSLPMNKVKGHKTEH